MDNFFGFRIPIGVLDQLIIFVYPGFVLKLEVFFSSLAANVEPLYVGY